VPLQGGDFAEKSCQGKPANGGATDQAKLNAEAMSRENERFMLVFHSLDRACHWCRDERHDFMQRLLGVSPRRTAPRPAQAPGLPMVEEVGLDVNLGGAVVPASSNDQVVGQGPDDDALPDAERPSNDQGKRRPNKFAPRSGQCSESGQGRQKDADVMDVDDVFVADKTLLDEAALQLVDAVSNLSVNIGTFAGAQILRASEAAPNRDSETESPTESESDEGVCAASVEQSNPSPVNRSNDQTLINSCVAPAIGGNDESVPWVAFKGRDGNVKIVTAGLYTEILRKGVLSSSQANVKTTSLMALDSLFGPDLVGEVCEPLTESTRASLRMLFKRCSGRFWGLPLGALSKNVASAPPSEVYQEISFEEFCGQYRTLAMWLRRVLRVHENRRAFEHIKQYIVEPLLKPVSQKSSQVRVSPDDIRMPAQNSAPEPGTEVLSRTIGRCRVIKIIARPNMTELYALAMRTDLGEIRWRGVWNVVVGWQYYMHLSTSSESLAESVGSVLAFLVKQNSNQQLSLKDIVLTAQLRAAGIKGMGGEDGIMAMALNTHFGCSGPEFWHFTKKGREANGVSLWSSAVRRSLARDRPMTPAWVPNLLLDVMRAGSTFAKKLPLPADMYVGCRDADDSVSQKRQRISSELQKRNDPQVLAQRLWSSMGISRFSLPQHLRPGRNPR
jgi:hypothetical protein